MIKPYDLLLFDLDGTISDPAEGIFDCINSALSVHNHPKISEKQLLPLIGVNIDKTFKIILGDINAEQTESLVRSYREEYIRTGSTKNRLYDGIENFLLEANRSHVKMAICTSRREDIAKLILSSLNLTHHFEFVAGGDVGIEKWQQIENLKQQGQIPVNTLMIGDRASDLIGAHRNSIDSAGVLWGFGSREELEAEDPTYLFETPRDLLQLIP